MSSSVARPFLSRARRGPLAAIALAILVLTVGLILVGRRERDDWIDRQVRGMKRVEAAVGPLNQSRLVGYRVLPQFDCLVYRRGANVFALELCVDRSGRLIEAIDRRTPDRRYYSLRSEPTAARIRLDRVEVDRLLQRMGAKS